MIFMARNETTLQEYIMNGEFADKLFAGSFNGQSFHYVVVGLEEAPVFSAGESKVCCL